MRKKMEIEINLFLLRALSESCYSVQSARKYYGSFLNEETLLNYYQM